MGRGAYTAKAKLPKAAQDESSLAGLPLMPTKITRTNTDWRNGLKTASFLSRSPSDTKLAQPEPSPPILSIPSTRLPPQSVNVKENITRESSQPFESLVLHTDAPKDLHESSNSRTSQFEDVLPPVTTAEVLALPPGDAESSLAATDSSENLSVEETQSNRSSIYSRDSSSLFSRDSTSIYNNGDSASIYSSASSVYSSGASTYSFDEYGFKEFDRSAAHGSTDQIPEEEEEEDSLRPNQLSRPHIQYRTHSAPIRRTEFQDAAARENSTLTKKAALFKNSRLHPDLPSYTASLPTWSLVCRAVQASSHCYNSASSIRRGIYTPANTSKQIKAMIIDEQFIDSARVIIVAIRGTECKSLKDWAVNKAAKPVKPTSFLDDEENLCHAGFLQVAKAMVSQVAMQLAAHPGTAQMPSLLFTGHSAGGAVAAMLYSHMLSLSPATSSELTALAENFSSINCMTFGSPPLSITPLTAPTHSNGVFLAFANEGDPVLRLSDAAYVKSLAKLMTASPPPSTTASTQPPKTKVVRRSRGTSVIREIAAPPAPWEELPLWPTPPPLLENAGQVILLRDKGTHHASASLVETAELRDVIFGDLVAHGTETYARRVRKCSLAAMMGE